MKASDIDLVSIPDAVDANADSYALIIENTELRKQQLKKLRYTRVLGQGGVPIYIPPTGSVAANGALTLGTALASVESGGMWGYLPAGAAYAASAAGFYWVVMSSTTLGTIYGNTYVPGTTDWRIPATLVAIVDAGPGAYTGVTTEVTAISVLMPGGSMGPNGRTTSSFILETSGGAGTKTTRFKFGGSTVTSPAVTTSAYDRSQVSSVWNRGVTNAQVTPGSTNDVSAGTTPAVRTAIDTTAPVELAVTLQNSNPATDWCAVLAWAFETRYQP